MTEHATLPAPAEHPAARVVDVEIVVPVHDEERDLEPSVRRLQAHLAATFPFSATITVADNASTDGTWAVATRLAAELPGVRAVHLDAKGRGRALRQVWRRAPRGSSPTWTSTCPPTSPRCCHWSRRCCPDTATWPSAAG